MKPHELPDQTAALQQQAQQLRYASVLDVGTWVGKILLLLSFAADLAGWLPLQVAHERLPALWSQPVQRYVQLADWPTGWHWLGMAGHADIANMLGIALFCLCSAICLLALLPNYVRRGDRAYVGLCVAEVAVLLLAASGVMS